MRADDLNSTPHRNAAQSTSPKKTMTISTPTNRSCVLLRALTVEIRDMPIAPVGDDDVLVKVEATGICGSDVRSMSPNRLHIRLC